MLLWLQNMQFDWQLLKYKHTFTSTSDYSKAAMLIYSYVYKYICQEYILLIFYI